MLPQLNTQQNNHKDPFENNLVSLEGFPTQEELLVKGKDYVFQFNKLFFRWSKNIHTQPHSRKQKYMKGKQARVCL